MFDTWCPSCVQGEDNHAAIQQAIDEAARNGGGVVALPPGVWPISASLRLSDHVTLRGVGLTATTLTTLGDAAAPLVAVEGPRSEGWSIEALGLDGCHEAGSGRGALHAILVEGEASYVILRRLRIRRVSADAVAIRGPTLANLFLEELFVEGCRSDGLVLAASSLSTGVFLSDVVIRDFGTPGRPSAALRLNARCHVSQLHIEPVRPGNVGLQFGQGSDHTVVSGLYVGLAGGTARMIDPGVSGISIATEAVRHLEAA